MDRAEFEQVYRSEYPRIVAQLVVLCAGDRAEAADCVQEAFVKAWQHRTSLDSDAGGWVRTAAVRLAVSRWRQRRTAAAAWLRQGTRRVEAGPGLDEGLDPRSAVVRALAVLPRRQREAVVLHHLMDMSVAQVAEAMAVPDGTVKAWLSRGRAELRTQMDGSAVVVAGTMEETA